MKHTLARAVGMTLPFLAGQTAGGKGACGALDRVERTRIGLSLDACPAPCRSGNHCYVTHSLTAEARVIPVRAGRLVPRQPGQAIPDAQALRLRNTQSGQPCNGFEMRADGSWHRACNVVFWRQA